MYLILAAAFVGSLTRMRSLGRLVQPSRARRPDSVSHERAAAKGGLVLRGARARPQSNSFGRTTLLMVSDAARELTSEWKRFPGSLGPEPVVTQLLCCVRLRRNGAAIFSDLAN